MFERYPEFPKDVPTTSMPKTSLKTLKSGNIEEATSLFNASRELGFFLLDLRGESIGQNYFRILKLYSTSQKKLCSWIPKKKLDTIKFLLPS